MISDLKDVLLVKHQAVLFSNIMVGKHQERSFQIPGNQKLKDNAPVISTHVSKLLIRLCTYMIDSYRDAS